MKYSRQHLGWLFSLFCVFSTLLCASNAFATDKVKLAVTDIVGLEELQREFSAFQETLSKHANVSVEFYPITSRTVVIEALRSKRVDFVLTGPAEYVILKKRSNATPLVRFSRPDYFSCVAVLADSKINGIADLKGKKVAFGDVGSTAYHLGPMQLIKDAGLNPQSDIKPMHVSKHIAWQALKRGDVSAIGLKHEQFTMFRDKEKDLEPGAFRVIARGRDLPSDILVAGSHVNPDIQKRLKSAFAEHSDELISAILKGERNQKYRGMKFLADVKDSDYNYVRQMYATAGYPEYSEFL